MSNGLGLNRCGLTRPLLIPNDLNVDINEAGKNWTELGEGDPMWVVLTAPDKSGNRWSEEDFFETGRVEIDEVFQKMANVGVVPATGKALDFGCGVGRLISRRFRLGNMISSVR